MSSSRVIPTDKDLHQSANFPPGPGPYAGGQPPRSPVAQLSMQQPPMMQPMNPQTVASPQTQQGLPSPQPVFYQSAALPVAPLGVASPGLTGQYVSPSERPAQAFPHNLPAQSGFQGQGPTPAAQVSAQYIQYGLPPAVHHGGVAPPMIPTQHQHQAQQAQQALWQHGASREQHPIAVVTAQPAQGQRMQYAGPSDEELKKQRRKEQMSQTQNCLGETCIVCGKMCMVGASLGRIMMRLTSCLVRHT
jgi:hypothetical protein